MPTPHSTPPAQTVPLPPSPSSSTSSTSSTSSAARPAAPPLVSRPSLRRSATSKTVLGSLSASLSSANGRPDPFHEGSTIHVSQPVGSLSISPSFRDVCLASRKGLYILDLADLERAPRFIAQGGTWQIAESVSAPPSSTASSRTLR